MDRKKNFDIGKRNEYKVIDFIIRRNITLHQIQTNYSHFSSFTDNYDIDVPELDLKIEVKSSHFGKIKFEKKNYRKEVNLYAFVNSINDFIVFLTKREFLDVIGRKNLKRNHTKTIHLKLYEIYQKALELGEVYND
jgi:hypothetical protein